MRLTDRQIIINNYFSDLYISIARLFILLFGCLLKSLPSLLHSSLAAVLCFWGIISLLCPIILFEERRMQTYSELRQTGEGLGNLQPSAAIICTPHNIHFNQIHSVVMKEK